MVYNGSTICNTTVPSCAQMTATASSWIVDDGTGDQSANGGAHFSASVPASFSGIALPIKIVIFKAVLNPDQSVFLFWQTAQEINNSHYLIERAGNDGNFESIGNLSGAGNSTAITEYSFQDLKPLARANYYRLRQVDFDGQFSYSPIVSVMVGEAGGVRLYPSPVQDLLHVQTDAAPEETTQWQISDQTGRLLQSGSFSSNIELNVAGLPAGTYTLRLINGQQVQSRQFVKQGR